MRSHLLPLACALAALSPVAANAAVLERTVSLTATNFASFQNEPSPFDELSLLFTVVIDTDGGLIDSAVLSSTLGYPLKISYVGSFYDYLQVATTPESPFGLYVRPGMSEFGFTLSGLGSGNLGIGNVSYSTADPSTVWYAGKTNVELVPSAVPEPTTWAMMLAGFAMLGFALRRRTKMALARRTSKNCGI